MPIVVSDTSPLRALHFLGRLDLLATLFERVLIPPAVRDELLVPRQRFKPVRLEDIPGAEVRAPSDRRTVTELLPQLEPGEAEAIALATEVGARLLIDEKIGRSIALSRGLPVTGVIGLLVRAKARGLVPAVTPLLERLRDELGFYISPRLLEQARGMAGE